MKRDPIEILLAVVIALCVGFVIGYLAGLIDEHDDWAAWMECIERAEVDYCDNLFGAP